MTDEVDLDAEGLSARRQVDSGSFATMYSVTQKHLTPTSR